MKLSVVIATFNRKDSLAECLRTLSNQDLSQEEFEIVVVIDGSTDGTVEMLRSLVMRVTLVLIEQSNRGQTAALNTGVGRSRGELVLFLDDDMLCDPNLLSAHCKAHEGAEEAVVIGHTRSVLSDHAGLAERSMHAILLGYNSALEKKGYPVWPDNACIGPNCSMSRRMFLDTGGFDYVSFPRRWEDVELGIRLWKRGIAFRFAPQAVVEHRYVKQKEQSWVDTEEDGASIVRMYKKHPDVRADSVMYDYLDTPSWKRLPLCLLSRRRFLRVSILGAMVRCLEPLHGWNWERRLRSHLFSLQRLAVSLAGARREAGSWPKLNRLFRQSLPVLLYHHIGTPNATMEEHALSVSPAKFRRQMNWLRFRGYRPITSRQWLDWLTRGTALPNKPVMLTFDDGYLDLVDNAFPVLEDHKFPALVFLITELREMNNRWAGATLLTFNQIRQWASRGIEFGGHTRNHVDLSAISFEEAREEVRGCKSDLNNMSLEATAFAYPFGSINEQARESVEGVFELAFTCEGGLNDLKTDPLLLKRTMVLPSDTLLDLELRLRSGRNPLDPLKAKLRIRSRFAGLLRLKRTRT